MYPKYTIKKFFFDVSSTWQFKYFIFANKKLNLQNILFAQTVPSSKVRYSTFVGTKFGDIKLTMFELWLEDQNFRNLSSEN